MCLNPNFRSHSEGSFVDTEALFLCSVLSSTESFTFGSQTEVTSSGLVNTVVYGAHCGVPKSECNRNITLMLEVRG